MDEQTRRIGQNQALFRSVNEKLEDVNEAFALVTETFDIVCECGDIDCMERIAMPVDVYERIRSNPNHFVVVPEHGRAAVERVVDAHPTWEIIEKRTPEARNLASETDPRR